MLTFLNNISDTAKRVLLFVVAPVAFIGGYIYYLLFANQELKDEIKKQEVKDRVEKFMQSVAKDEQAANEATNNYNAVTAKDRESGESSTRRD